MEKYQICNTHQEQVEFISRDVNTNELIGICLNCLPLPQGVPYQSKKNILINLENNKFLMIKHFQDQKDQNVKTIRKLIEYLNQYKKTQAEQLDTLISQGEQEIYQMEKKNLHSQNLIKEYNASIDVEQLIIFYNALQDEGFLEKTQQQLLEMLISIQQQSFLFDSYKILQQLPSTLHLDLSNTENNNNLKKVYKCPKHNQFLVGVDLNASHKDYQGIICLNCINDSNGAFTKIEEAESKWKEYHQQSKGYQEKLESLVQKLSSQAIIPIQVKYDKAQRNLERFLRILQTQKNSKLQELKQIAKDQIIGELDYTSVEHFQQLQKISKISVDYWSNLEWDLYKFQNVLEQRNNKIYSSISRLNQFSQIIVNPQINQMSQAKIQYEKISVIKQEEACYAMAINSEGNILVAGCNEKIKVFEFNSGVLNKLQILDGHLIYINCLQFMKNQNTFISASDDRTIKLWKQQSGQNWNAIYTLDGHDGRIFSFVINLAGDQIISGGQGKFIRFWVQNNEEWSNLQTISVDQQEVWSLSLNESESKLISCGKDGQILIIEQVQKNEWSVVQIIQKAYGCRLCFITNDIFSFQPNEGQLQIYQHITQQKEFTLIKSIEVSENQNIKFSKILFPQKFIKSNQVLVSKHKNYLNIIKRVKNEEFLVDQCIEFTDEYHYGTITDDGEYLVTWDNGSREIKVRQCQEVVDSK